MKKTIGVLIFVLCLLLSGTALAADLKIGYINMRKAFYECKKTKEFQKELEAKDEAAKKEFEQKAESFRKLRDEVDLLSDKAKEKKQAELRQKATELDEYRKTKGEELIRWRDEEIRKINTELVSATEAFAKKNGFNVIMDKMAVIYSTGENDITDQVLGQVNK